MMVRFKTISSKLWKLLLVITFLWVGFILFYNYIAEVEYEKINIPYGQFTSTIKGVKGEKTVYLLKAHDGSFTILIKGDLGEEKLLKIGKEEIILEIEAINLLKPERELQI